MEKNKSVITVALEDRIQGMLLETEKIQRTESFRVYCKGQRMFLQGMKFMGRCWRQPYTEHFYES